jgi:uncharacterized protein GlcG (DUF336 family)
MRPIPWLIALVLAALPWAAGGQAVLAERTLAVAAANEAAMTALEQCRKDGHRVAVTVLDHAGRTKVMVRDDGANPHTVQHSLNKAYTALTFRTASGEYGKRAAAAFPGSSGALHLDKITTAAGGLPIRAGKDIVGAIGVSGSPGTPGGPAGGATDEKCAQAGIERIGKGLSSP